MTEGGFADPSFEAQPSVIRRFGDKRIAAKPG